MFPVAARLVVPDHQIAREHDRVADVVAGGDVAADLAVVGVHVVDGEADVLEAVVAELVVMAGRDEDAVAAMDHRVADDLGPRRVPELDAVAALAAPQIGAALDPVAADQHVGGAPDIDPDQVVDQVVVLDHRSGRFLGQEDAGILVEQAEAGVADGEIAQRHAGRFHGHGVPRPPPSMTAPGCPSSVTGVEMVTGPG